MPNESFRLCNYALLGVLLFVGLRWCLGQYSSFAVSFSEAPSVPIWYALSISPLTSLVSVAPAFVIGWLSNRHGFVLGAVVGAGGSLAQSALFSVTWSNVMAWGWLLAHLLSYALAAAIISSLASAAAQSLRHSLPSNRSLQPTALAGRG